jgi:hypothetical protein
MRIWGLSKQAARYRKAPVGDARCDCSSLPPPTASGGNMYVQRGVIRGSATCDEFKPRATS